MAYISNPDDGDRNESNAEERFSTANIDPSLRPRPQTLTLPTTSSAATDSLSHGYGNVLLPSQSIVTNSLATQQDAYGGVVKSSQPQEIVVPQGCFLPIDEDPLDGYYASFLGDDEQDQYQTDDDGPLLWYFITLFQEETAAYCQPTPVHHPFPPAIPVAGPSNHTALVHMTPSQNTLPQGQFHGGSHSAHPHATPFTQESDDVDDDNDDDNNDNDDNDNDNDNDDKESDGSQTTVPRIRCRIRLRGNGVDPSALGKRCNVRLLHDEKFLQKHFKMHNDQNELEFNLDNCPFPKVPNKPCRSKDKEKNVGYGQTGVRVFARHVEHRHFRNVPRKPCPNCVKSFARKDSIGRCKCTVKKETVDNHWHSSGSAATPDYNATFAQLYEENGLPAVTEESDVYVWGAESQNAGQSSSSRGGR